VDYGSHGRAVSSIESSISVMPKRKLRYPALEDCFRPGVLCICGSMNAGYGIAWLCCPRPLEQDRHPHPLWLAVTTNFVASRVQESSRNGGATPADIQRAGLLRRCCARGYLQDCLETSTPMVAERVRCRGCLAQGMLAGLYQIRLFRGLNARYDVRFATFFKQLRRPHQHYYWRHMSRNCSLCRRLLQIMLSSGWPSDGVQGQ